MFRSQYDHVRCAFVAFLSLWLLASTASARPSVGGGGGGDGGDERRPPENGARNESQPLSLRRLFDELLAEPKVVAEAHLGSMLLVASYGDRFYNLREHIDDECRRVLAATVAMTTNLRTFEKVDAIMDAVMADGYEDIVYAGARGQLKHPLRFLCDRIEQRFLYASVTDARLYGEFVRLKEAAKNGTMMRRKPYLIRISKSEQELGAFYLHMMKIPQMAKYVAHEGFEDQLYASEAYNRTFHALAKAILAVAKKETDDAVRQAVQRLYERTLGEAADYISRTPYEKLRLLEDQKTYWFSEFIMARLKRYFDEDATLKRELESTMDEMQKMDQMAADQMKTNAG